MTRLTGAADDEANYTPDGVADDTADGATQLTANITKAGDSRCIRMFPC